MNWKNLDRQDIIAITVFITSILLAIVTAYSLISGMSEQQYSPCVTETPELTVGKIVGAIVLTIGFLMIIMAGEYSILVFYGFILIILAMAISVAHACG